MADIELILPRELQPATDVFPTDALVIDNGAGVYRGTPVQIVDAGAPVPSEAVALAGTDNTSRMTPLRVKQVLSDAVIPQVEQAKAWAQSPTAPDPAIPGSKSAKSWAAEAERLGKEQADRAQLAALIASAFEQTDLQMQSVTVPAEANIITRFPSGFSTGQVAPQNALTWWRRITTPTTEPYFTTAGGAVWVQVGYDERKILSTLQSAIEGVMANPALTGAQPFTSLAAFNTATIPAPVNRVQVSTPYGTLSFIRGPSVAGIRTGWRPDGDFDPGHFGADYSGANDSSAALQACFDAAQGEFPISTLPGKLTINSFTTPRYSNQYIDLGSTEINGRTFTGWTDTSSAWNTGRNRALIEPRGEMVADDLTLTAAVTAGGSTISVSDASMIEPGDIITLRSSGELWYTYVDGVPIPKRDVNRVVSVSGNEVKLDFPVRFPFSITGFTVTVHVVRPIKNITIVGGIFEGGGVRSNMLNGFGPCALAPEGVDGLIFSPISVSGFQNSAYASMYCLNDVTKDFMIQGHADDYAPPIVEDQNSGFNGITRGWGRFGITENVVADRTRHLVDGFNTFDVRVSDCTPMRNHKASYTCHGGCSDWAIDLGPLKNTSDYGLNWRGFNLIVDGGNIDVRSSDRSNYGIIVGVGGANDLYRTLIFNNVKCKAENPAIQISATNIERIELNSCDFECNTGAPVRVLSPRFRSFVVRGGRYVSSGTQLFQFQETSLQNTGATIDIQGAILEGYNVSPVRIFDTATGTNVICKGVTLRPAAGGESVPTVRYDARASGIWDVGPNYRGTTFVESGTLPNTSLSVKFGGADTGVTYATNNCWYTRANNTIQFNAYVSLSSKGTATGALSIDGLPGAAITLGAAAVSIRMNIVDPSLDNANISASIQGGTNEVRIFKLVAGAETRLTDADIRNTTGFWISGNYRLQNVTS